eukprot:CAMPEP_0172607774 /NCGR_PEP_ID=MMETSP1068-20121228/27917_1 /TAXON_ID=35684 /ORGANISM="Pseudopedinella elastica, Strain CCMP716" /LENGTH=250 /DNA_ID=CAMNT_0013410863 /DNA_START=176 /DNA_END=925 /DNA_ORIENTATION=+
MANWRFLRGMADGHEDVKEEALPSWDDNDDTPAPYGDDPAYKFDDDAMQQYESMVFTSVLVGMMVCCLCSCMLKRLQHCVDEAERGRGSRGGGGAAARRNRNGASSRSRRQRERSRSDVFRNSLFESGEEDWACGLCGFGNRPRVAHCSLCGLDRDKMLFQSKQVAKAARKVFFLSGAAAAAEADEPVDGDTGSGLGGEDGGEDEAGFLPEPLHLTDRQLRAARRLLWRREPRREKDQPSGELGGGGRAL